MKKILLLLGVIALGAASCKKGDLPTQKTLSVGTISNKSFAAADGAWDLLGYGLDATGDLLNSSSVSDAPVIDITRFAADYRSRLDINGTIEGTQEIYTGVTAFDYLNDITLKKTKDASGNSTIDIPSSSTGTGTGASTGTAQAFTQSVSKNSSDSYQSKNTYSSKYSYATYDIIQKVKRIRFTGDATLDLLMTYLTPEFINNVNTLSADDLVKRYGTHVMLDISIGGILRFNYSGSFISESDYTNRSGDVKVALGVGLNKTTSININSDKNSTQIAQITSLATDNQYTAQFYGGTNGGTSVTIDKDGNASQTINLASWQQTVSPTNAALLSVAKSVFLYDLIADPTKKAAVKTAVETYIASKQITLVPVPVYEYWSLSGADHYYTTVQKDYGSWTYDLIAFKAYPAQVPGTVPVYEYWNSVGVDHYYTTENRDYGTWAYSKIAFFAYPSQISGTVPVFEYWNNTGADHYYTTVFKDYGDWQYSKVGFYSFPN